jgi:hypothetical protein
MEKPRLGEALMDKHSGLDGSGPSRANQSLTALCLIDGVASSIAAKKMRAIAGPWFSKAQTEFLRHRPVTEELFHGR